MSIFSDRRRATAHVKGALIIAAAILIAAFGAAYMLSPERDVERCVRVITGSILDFGDYEGNYALCFEHIHQMRWQ
jgi:hypothetical protein